MNLKRKELLSLSAGESRETVGERFVRMLALHVHLKNNEYFCLLSEFDIYLVQFSLYTLYIQMDKTSCTHSTLLDPEPNFSQL